MIIVLVIETFNVHNNGITISATRFAENLKARGHQIRVVTCGDPNIVDSETLKEYEMYFVPELIIPIASKLAHKQNTLFAKPIKAILEKAIFGADIVHIYQPWSLGNAARKLANRMNVPVIAAFHVQPENITYNIGLGWLPGAAHITYLLFNWLFYSKFSHIHCPSPFIAAQLQKHGYKSWLRVISNGVHPMFTPGSSRKEHQEAEPWRILMIGRLSAEKRQDILIRAVARSKYADRIQLFFAGSGPKERELTKLGNLLPLKPVFGYYDQPTLLALIRQCDLYVHASDIEIEGIACLEAISCGLVPIISNSKRSAASQFALSSNNLFLAGNPDSLAEKIDFWLDHHSERAQMSQQYVIYSRKYLLSNSVQQLEQLYYEMKSSNQNTYYHSFAYRVLTSLFYTLIAVPILFIFTRLFLGVRINGKENIKHLDGALTLCNHVHTLDCALIAIALFPHKVLFPTLQKNTESIWYGQLVKLLGGIPIPDNLTKLKQFLREMEIMLAKGQYIHFYPEGNLRPYATNLLPFKRGAFYLAARARVPLVPMAISYHKPTGLRKVFRNKPDLILHIGKPIYPISSNEQEDIKIRLNRAEEQINEMLCNTESVS